MKNLEILIISILIIIFVGGLTVNCTAQQKQKIYFNLSELIKSTDEVECFANYFDIQPEIISSNLNKYRRKYKRELEKAGYKVTSDDNSKLIFTIVFISADGKIIPYKKFINAHKPKVLRDDKYQTVFEHPVP